MWSRQTKKSSTISNIIVWNFSFLGEKICDIGCSLFNNLNYISLTFAFFFEPQEFPTWGVERYCVIHIIIYILTD